MKYLSIDIETTGLNCKADQILEFAAIFEDTTRRLDYEDVPKFTCIIDHGRIKGGDFVALNMNADILKKLSDYYMIPSSNVAEKRRFKEKHSIMTPNEFLQNFRSFVIEHYYNGDQSVRQKTPLLFNVAGKSFDNFDRKFLNNFPYFSDAFKMHRRTIEPSHFFVNWEMDHEMPNLTKCKKRAGIDGKVTHVALEDAWDVVELVRKEIDLRKKL